MPPPEIDRRPPDWQSYWAAYDRASQQFQSDPNEHQLAILRAGEEILIRELLKPGKFALGPRTR